MSALLRSSSVKRSFLAMTDSSSMQQSSGCFFTFGCWSSRNPRSSAHLATSSQTSRPMFRVGCLGLRLGRGLRKTKPAEDRVAVGVEIRRGRSSGLKRYVNRVVAALHEQQYDLSLLA